MIHFAAQSEFPAVLSVGLQLVGVVLWVLLDLQPALPVVVSFAPRSSLCPAVMLRGHEVCKTHTSSSLSTVISRVSLGFKRVGENNIGNKQAY